jgi:hypothetical protein
VCKESGEWTKAVKPPAALFDARPASVEVLHKGIHALIPILRDGESAQQRAVIAFVSTVAPKLRKAPFVERVDALMQ